LDRCYYSKTPGIIIPRECIQLLPFSEIPADEWDDQGSLGRFLRLLCDRDGVRIDSEGTKQAVNYAFYAEFLYSSGLERIREHVSRFESEIASDESASTYQFLRSAPFGKAMQYEAAWKGTVSAILSEGAFFSLAHILEAEADLDCSLKLAQSSFYRQALQSLRCFLEDVLVQLYFCNEPANFNKWKLDDFQVPRLRGRGGYLQKLVEKGLLSESLAKRAHSLYGDLNASVHGAERELLYEGIAKGRNIGPAFLEERFIRWCNCYSECIDVALRALHEHLAWWDENRLGDHVVCSTCHGSESFQYVERRVAGRLIVRRTCTQCGTNLDFLSDEDPTQGFYEVSVKRTDKPEKREVADGEDEARSP
jgi:hypothetical protein